MSSAKKISQQQLRQMMRERKEIQSKQSLQTNKSAEEVTEDKRIESPLARYDGNRRLSCILCEQYISSDSVWSQHISSKSHKNKIEEMKRKKLVRNSIHSKIDLNSNQMSAPKQEEEKPLLKRKLTTNDTIEDQISNKLSKTNVDIKTGNISSDLMETEDNSEEQSVIIKSGSVLPNDFFDGPKEMVDESKQINDSKETETKSLPKGFFDDPVMDAKARKVVYKNPIDEQWEQFQKVIAEENTVSQNIIEEDIEVLQIDKNLEEIEEQIANWIKVNEMQKRAELLHNHIINNCDSNNIKQEMDSDSDLDENDLNVFSNWRSRTALNSK